MDTKWMPTVAGILNIIAGSLTLLGAVFSSLFTVVFFSSSYDGYSGQEYSALAFWLAVFIPLLIVSLLAIVGGIFALKKKSWGLALAGSICSLLTLWAWPLGIASIVFIALSKPNFNRPVTLFPESVIPPSSPLDNTPL